MGGGSSSSSQAQTTVQAEVTGNTGTVNTGDGRIQQGQTVFNSDRAQRIEIGTFEQIPEAVSDTFALLIDSFNKGISGAYTLTADALGKVENKEITEIQPAQASLDKFIPVIMAGIAGYVAIKVIK